MTFAPVGSPISASASTFSLTPNGVGNIIVIVAISLTGADTVTALSSSNVTWTQAVVPQVVGGPAATVFRGKVTSTSTATVTVTVSAGSPSLRIQGHEYSTTAGYSAVTLDTSGTMSGTTGGAYASLTPGHGAGGLYYGYAFNSGSAIAGSTSGYSYNVDGNGNGACWNAACTSSAQQPTWGDTGDNVYGVAVLLYEATGATGSGALAAKKAVTAGAGSETFAGSGSAARRKPVAAGTGSEAFTGSGSALRQKPAATGTGVLGGAAGAGALAAKKPAVAGTGAQALAGAGTLAAKKVTAAGSGSVAGVAPTGSGGITRARASATGSGSETFAGTGSVARRKPAVAGAGAYSVAGSGSVTASKAALAGTGTAGTPPPFTVGVLTASTYAPSGTSATGSGISTTATSSGINASSTSP